MTKQSRYSYSETVERLSKAISDAGIKIFDTIDQAAAAAQVGMTLRPTALIIFGNPRAGTPFMQAFPLMALELPLKTIVWEENGTVSVAYTPFTELAARYHVTGMDEAAAKLDVILEKLVSSVAAESTPAVTSPV